MSFINNVKAMKKTTTGGATNPFAKTTPVAPTGNPFRGMVSKTQTQVAPTMAGMKKPPVPGFTPPSMKKQTAIPKMVKEEVKATEEVKAEEVKVVEEVKVEEVTPKEEVKVVAKALSFVKKAENVEVEIAEAPKKIEVEEIEVEEEPKAKKTTAKKASSKKATTKKTVAKKEEAPAKEISEESNSTKAISIPTTEMNYADALKAIKSPFVDQEWEEFRKEVLAESDAIEIESDMNEGSIKKTIAKLSKLRETIWLTFSDTKVILDSLVSKESKGLIDRVEAMNMIGSSSDVRKQSAILATMNYKTPNGENINLYEVYQETLSRLEFLKATLETIQYKSSVLITMSSAVKMQKNSY